MNYKKSDLFGIKIIGLLLLILWQFTASAQDAASPDTLIGLGTFSAAGRIAVQPDGKIIIASGFVYYRSKPVNGMIRLNPDESVDPGFNIGNGPGGGGINAMVLQPDGKILIGGSFTSINNVLRNYLARLNSDGSVDTTFKGTGGNNGNGIYSLAIQADGKILVGGYFTTYNGTPAYGITRLNNDGTTDITFSTGSNYFNFIYAIAIDSTNKILIGGAFYTYNGAPNNSIARLNPDGSFDNSFSTSFNTPSTYDYSPVEVIAILPGGKILAGGSFTYTNGVTIPRLVRLNYNGSLDNTFSCTGADARVRKIVVQKDGKIILAGDFSNVNNTSQKYISRLTSNGLLDNSFNSGSGAGSSVGDVALKADGSILLTGGFNSYNGDLFNGLVHLNSDGTADLSFNQCSGSVSNIESINLQNDGKIVATGEWKMVNGVIVNPVTRWYTNGNVDPSFNTGTGANQNIHASAIQKDGKIIIGGSFTSFNGVAKKYFVRLNNDGSVDNSFNSGAGVISDVYSIAIQEDGKILVGGAYSTKVARLNADGTIDNTFNVGTGLAGSPFCIKIQKDNKIIIAGSFSSFNGSPCGSIVRLNPDGSIDHSFKSGSGANNTILALEIQEDDKLMIGGNFTTFNLASRNRIARLNPDGTLDRLFIPGIGADNQVRAIAVQEDGKVIIGGTFAYYNSVLKRYMARLNIDGSLDDSFSPGFEPDWYVFAIHIQPDGKILMGGWFKRYRNKAYNHIMRLQGEPNYLSSIKGKIFSDKNKDCQFQASDIPLSSIIVKAIPGPYYGGSDGFGNYKLKVDTGKVNYTVTQEPNALFSKLLINQCAPSYTVPMNGGSKNTCCYDFADSIKQCALLNLSIQNIRMRPCAVSNTFLNYCNYGNQTSGAAQIKVIYPSYVRAVSSNPPWASKQDSVLIYNLDPVAEGACGQIIIRDSVYCRPEITGQTACIKASISPSSNCKENSPSWDGSSVSVKGNCMGTYASFVIINSGSFDMTKNSAYRIFLNDSLIYIGSFQLKAGQQLKVKYPAGSSTVRLEADQSEFHPGKSFPRATVEGCTSAPSLSSSFVKSSPQDDLDEETAITCNLIRNSSDPNGKQVMPEGISAAHNIVPGQELEFTIHFQNTGSDTAYLVRVVDTLDVSLDVSTLTMGASSHPYTLDVSGKGKAVLTYTFVNINLPDSTANKVASSGLISFRITVPPGTPIGTIIKNKASIFFDYNAPIITNETHHTVDTLIYKDFSKGNMVQEEQVTTGISVRRIQTQVKVYPNPSNGIITVEDASSTKNSQLIIYSLIGVLQKSVSLKEAFVQQVSLDGLHEGIYLYEILQEGARKAGGLIQIK